MPSVNTVPEDIIALIADNLSPVPGGSKTDLVTCSKLNRTWNRVLLSHLFRDLTIKIRPFFRDDDNKWPLFMARDYMKCKTWYDWSQFLNQHPEIWRYIRHCRVVMKMTLYREIEVVYPEFRELLCFLRPESFPAIRSIFLQDVYIAPNTSNAAALPAPGDTRPDLSRLHVGYTSDCPTGPGVHVTPVPIHSLLSMISTIGELVLSRTSRGMADQLIPPDLSIDHLVLHTMCAPLEPFAEAPGSQWHRISRLDLSRLEDKVSVADATVFLQQYGQHLVELSVHLDKYFPYKKHKRKSFRYEHIAIDHLNAIPGRGKELFKKAVCPKLKRLTIVMYATVDQDHPVEDPNGDQWRFLTEVFTEGSLFSVPELHFIFYFPESYGEEYCECEEDDCDCEDDGGGEDSDCRDWILFDLQARHPVLQELDTVLSERPSLQRLIVSSQLGGWHPIKPWYAQEEYSEWGSKRFCQRIFPKLRAVKKLMVVPNGGKCT